MDIDNPNDLVLLPPEVAGHLEARGAWPTHGEVADYFRANAISGSAPHAYSDIRAGVAAERQHVVGLLRLLEERGLSFGPLPLEPGDAKVWRSFESMWDVMFSAFQEAPNGRVRNPDRELPVVAASILPHLANLHATEVSDLPAITRGEIIMRRRAAELTDFLAMLYAADPMSVLYAVNSRGKPVSVVVSTGVTDEACEAICGGRMRDADLTPADLRSPGKCVFDFAIANLLPAPPVNFLARAAAEIRTVHFQSAYFTRHLTPYRPTVFCVGGSPLMVRRLNTLGFSPTGHTLSGSDKPMMVLHHPADAPAGLGFRKTTNYKLLVLSLRAFRVANRRRWRRR